MNKHFAICFLLFCVGNSKSEVDRSVDEVSSSFSECAAYFAVVSIALESSKKHELANTYNSQSEMMNLYSLELASQNRSKEVAEKVVLSRFKLFLKSMMKEINEDASNISILMGKHLEDCDLAASNPDQFSKVIIDRYFDSEK